MRYRSIPAVAVMLLVTAWVGASALGAEDRLLTRTVEVGGDERTYHVGLPEGFDPDATYWPLVFAHGGGGRPQTNFHSVSLRRQVAEQSLPAIVVLPEFVTADKQVSRFPALGEDAFLKAVLEQVRGEYRLQPKILLTGYSMGGQFSHRFALLNPELVQACAPFAAGTWTTPDGRLLIEQFGAVADPDVFLRDRENVAKVPARLSDLFDERVAGVAGRRAAAGVERVPFLVMCGTLDTRHEIAVEFAKSLLEAGVDVETEWPETAHGGRRPENEGEFAKYAERAVRFFRAHTEERQ